MKKKMNELSFYSDDSVKEENKVGVNFGSQTLQEMLQGKEGKPDKDLMGWMNQVFICLLKFFPLSIFANCTQSRILKNL